MKHTLRGSTLAETLVMMLVAGIVFLAAMEALLYLYRAGGETTLTTRDSAAVFVAGEFRDTLLRRVGHMQLLRCDAAADTLEIDVGSHMLKLPVLRPAWESYGRRIAEIEKDHGYEEP